MTDRTVGTAAGIEPPLSWLRIFRISSAVSSSRNLLSEFFEWFGDLGVFLWRVAWAAVTPPFEFRELFRQLDEIGSKSLPLVALAGGAIGHPRPGAVVIFLRGMVAHRTGGSPFVVSR